MNPKVSDTDEPLSNLDAKLRVQMRIESSKHHENLGATIVYVTHEQTEAMTLGTRIVVMKDGFIQQVDTPQNLYDSPVNTFVAGFIGSPQMNFINAVLAKKDGKYVVEFGAENQFSVEILESKAKGTDIENFVGKEVILGIRPENLHDEEMFLSSATTGVIECDVEVTEMMGSETYLYLSCDGNPMIARVDPRSTAKAGDKIKVALDVNRIHLFDKETEKVICN